MRAKQGILGLVYTGRTREVCPADRRAPAPPNTPPILGKPGIANGDQPSNPAPNRPSGIATASSPLKPVKAATASATTPPTILMARASTAGLAARNICSSKYRTITATAPAIRVGIALV